MCLHFDTRTLTKFYEKEREREISKKYDFANAERDWRMPLILQGKDFLDAFL
jgi:hypothetical protein